MKRPWRIEYEDAEGKTKVERTFHLKILATLALPGIEKENPGVQYRIEKHVEFEAKK